MSVEHLDLSDYLAIAAEVTGLDVETVIKVADLDLADSALHAPSAGFGDTDFYPDFIDKAAVLIVRLTKNHPLPDGNKRAAWVSLRTFVDVKGGRGIRSPGSTKRNRQCSPSPLASGTNIRRLIGSATTSDQPTTPDPVRSSSSPRKVRRETEQPGEPFQSDERTFPQVRERFRRSADQSAVRATSTTLDFYPHRYICGSALTWGPGRWSPRDFSQRMELTIGEC